VRVRGTLSLAARGDKTLHEPPREVESLESRRKHRISDEDNHDRRHGRICEELRVIRHSIKEDRRVDAPREHQLGENRGLLLGQRQRELN